MTVVAISAAYGAMGGIVGPALAERLEVPFVDRALTHWVASSLDVSVEEAQEQWEPPNRSFLERILASFHGVDAGAAPVGPPPPTTSVDDFRRAAESAVLTQAATGEGVILGRGSVAALRDDPRVLRVRLTGPRAARLTRAVDNGNLGTEQARETMKRLDRFHADYMREFYEADIDDPTLYHVILDTTSFDAETCVSLLELAARAIL